MASLAIRPWEDDMLHITVGRGDEDYATIQEAIDAVPYDMPAQITISEGVYREKLFSDKESISLCGSGDVTIIWSDSASRIDEGGRRLGTFRSYTAFFGGRHVFLRNLAIVNDSGDGSLVGQGIALYLDAARAELEDVRLIGHQDTLFLAPLPEKEREPGGFYGPRHLIPRRMTSSVFRRCRIEGTVDFIFGSGDALFLSCDIVSAGPGYAAAPSGSREGRGLVFDSCRFIPSFAGDGPVYLMRPWRDEGKASFVSCRFGAHIAPEGLAPWPGRDGEIGRCTFLVAGCSFDGRESIPLSCHALPEDIRKIAASFADAAE